MSFFDVPPQQKKFRAGIDFETQDLNPQELAWTLLDHRGCVWVKAVGKVALLRSSGK